MSEVDYQGAGTDKVSSRSETATPINLVALSFNATGGSVLVTSGPLQVKGKSVGRSKKHTFNVDLTGTDRGQPLAFFSVPLPAAGVRAGQSWRARVFAPAPIPAGLQASYKCKSISGGFALIGFDLKADGACHVEGSGTLFVRTSDGLLDHGSSTFELTYRRPVPGQQGKLSVDSHVVMKSAISKQ